MKRVAESDSAKLERAKGQEVREKLILQILYCDSGFNWEHGLGALTADEIERLPQDEFDDHVERNFLVLWRDGQNFGYASDLELRNVTELDPLALNGLPGIATLRIEPEEASQPVAMTSELFSRARSRIENHAGSTPGVIYGGESWDGTTLILLTFEGGGRVRRVIGINAADFEGAPLRDAVQVLLALWHQMAFAGGAFPEPPDFGRVP